MANLTRFDPFNLGRSDLFGAGFEDLFRRMWQPTRFELESMPDVKLDVTERDNAYLVKAEMPGVDKESIKVDINGNLVSISAETRREKEEKDKKDKVIRSERYYGAMSRSFTLMQDIDETKAEARYVDGVLELMLPKKAQSTSKRVVVR